jgi:predicted  nucleic acid-binding Zn-ribbon protein
MEEAKNKLREYADLKEVIKKFEKKIKAMQPELFKILEQINPGEEDHKVSTDFGSFSAVPKRKYTYSVDTQVLIDKVSAEKEREEQDGTASYEVNPYLKFDAPKVDHKDEE